MNLRSALKLVGRIELIVAAFMLPALAVAFYYEESHMPFVRSIAVMLCICGPLALLPAQPVFPAGGLCHSGPHLDCRLYIRQPARLALRLLGLLCGLPV